MKRIILALLVLSLLGVCAGCSGPGVMPEDRQTATGDASLQAVEVAGGVFQEIPVETPEPERHYSGSYGYIILDDGTVEIDICRSDPKELIVPDQLDGRKVTRIGDSAFLICSKITSITIPDSVTSIGAGSFSGCRSLTSITIPDSVTSIGNEAFFGCISLTSITIPNSVTSIGVNPFESCDKLTSIIVSPDHPTLEVMDGVLFSKPDKRLVCYPCAFKADSYVIPDGIQTIGGRAFYFNDSLSSVTIPDSVTSIEYGAFSNSALTSITIPDSVVSIGYEAFYACTRLASIKLSNNVTSIGDDAFDFCPITTISIPDSVTSMGCAFAMCSNLTSVIIPDSLTSIAVGMFSECSSLTSISIPETITGIGDRAFYHCRSLRNITIPASVTSIGEKVFMIEKNWEDVINPYLTVTVSRGSYAAQYCDENGINYAYSDASN